MTPALPASHVTPSALGGIAFGSTGTYLCHAFQDPIGVLTGTPHGLPTGLLLDILERAHAGAVAHR